MLREVGGEGVRWGWERGCKPNNLAGHNFEWFGDRGVRIVARHVLMCMVGSRWPILVSGCELLYIYCVAIVA